MLAAFHLIWSIKAYMYYLMSSREMSSLKVLSLCNAGISGETWWVSVRFDSSIVYSRAGGLECEVMFALGMLKHMLTNLTTLDLPGPNNKQESFCHLLSFIDRLFSATFITGNVRGFCFHLFFPATFTIGIVLWVLFSSPFFFPCCFYHWMEIVLWVLFSSLFLLLSPLGWYCGFPFFFFSATFTIGIVLWALCRVTLCLLMHVGTCLLEIEVKLCWSLTAWSLTGCHSWVSTVQQNVPQRDIPGKRVFMYVCVAWPDSFEWGTYTQPTATTTKTFHKEGLNWLGLCDRLLGLLNRLLYVQGCAISGWGYNCLEYSYFLCR